MNIELKKKKLRPCFLIQSYRENYQYSYLDTISVTGLIISAVALVITIVHHLKEKCVHHLKKPLSILLH